MFRFHGYKIKERTVRANQIIQDRCKTIFKEFHHSNTQKRAFMVSILIFSMTNNVQFSRIKQEDQSEQLVKMC